jgi:hypothetical protein
MLLQDTEIKLGRVQHIQHIHMDIKCAECGCVPNIDCVDQTCNNCNKNVCCKPSTHLIIYQLSIDLSQIKREI